MNATQAMVASACAGIVSLGRLDLDPRSLIPKGAGVEIVTASSDHLILDLTDAAPVEVGDKVEFLLDYASLVQAIMSPGAPGSAPEQSMAFSVRRR